MNESKSTGKKKVKVIARMTIVKRGSAKRLIVEVHEDASFHQFYRWYSQEGRKHKRFIRGSQRNDGLPFTRAQNQPGLDVLAERQQSFNKDIENVTIKVFQKRIYNHLLNCRPDELGNGMPIFNTQGLRAAMPERFPATYTTLQKRMNIMTGAAG